MRVGWRRRAAITPKMYTSPQSCLTTGRCTIYNTHERIHIICILIPCLLGSPLPSCSWTSSFSRYCFALSGLFSCTIIASHSNCGRLPLCVCGFFSYCTYILLMDLRSFQRRYLFLSRYSSSQVWGTVGEGTRLNTQPTFHNLFTPFLSSISGSGFLYSICA